MTMGTNRAGSHRAAEYQDLARTKVEMSVSEVLKLTGRARNAYGLPRVSWMLTRKFGLEDEISRFTQFFSWLMSRRCIHRRSLQTGSKLIDP